jgi:RNA-directed DNA polymerase
VLEATLKAVVGNAGTAGVDGVTTEEIKASGAAYLAGRQTQMQEKSYRPSPLIHFWIPKGDGKQRPLGIPTVKDQVVQAALRVLLEPIIEADLHEAGFGYRPRRNAQQAVDAISRAAIQGKTEFIDADLSRYFDTTDHAALLRLVAQRVSDGGILKLVNLFLKAPIVQEKSGRRSIQPNDRGTPQGGVISPLLANLHLNSLDHGVNDQLGLDAKLVRYADDVVVLSRPGQGAEPYQRLKVYLERKGLTPSLAKTRVFAQRRQILMFIGFSVRWQRSPGKDRYYPHVEPSPKIRRKLRDSTRKILNRWTPHQSCKSAVTQVNRVVRGSSQYYHHGNCTRVFGAEQDWLCQRLCGWLWRKYDRSVSRWMFFNNERLHGQYQLFSFHARAPYLQ